MPRALFALCAICGALAWPIAASAATVNTKTYDIGMSVQTYPFNPCSQSVDPSLTVTFFGSTSTHVILKMQNGVATSAHVDVDQSGGLLTSLGGRDYIGGLSYSSKLNLNPQNQVSSVSFNIAAISTDFTSMLLFQVEERVTFNANDPDPVKETMNVVVASCPA